MRCRLSFMSMQTLRRGRHPKPSEISIGFRYGAWRRLTNQTMTRARLRRLMLLLQHQAASNDNAPCGTDLQGGAPFRPAPLRVEVKRGQN